MKFTFETGYHYNFPLTGGTQAFVDSIQALDEHTVSFKMKGPFASFLHEAGGTLIMPKHIWSKIDSVDTCENPHPVGSGPFLFKKFQARAFLDLVKDPNYWRGPANIDEVVIKVYLNPEVMVVALKKGEIDMIADLAGQEALIPALIGSPNVKVLVNEWPQTVYMAPNHRIYPLNLLGVRQAISLVVDREKIIGDALLGYGELPLMGFIPPAVSKWANTELTWKGLNMTEEERIAKANVILDDLGFKRGKDGIRVTDEGEKMEFRLRTMSYPSYVRACEAIKRNLEEIGIKTDVLVSDVETFIAGIIFGGKRTLDWDLAVSGTGSLPDLDTFGREYAPEPPTMWNCGPAFGWHNEEIESLLKQQKREMDETKRWEIAQKAQQLFADQLVIIDLAHRFHAAAYRTDKFTGWDPEPIWYGVMYHPLTSLTNILSLRPLPK